ncbi:MAG: alpha/beta hydrolase [Planctomycetota bacterium]
MERTRAILRTARISWLFGAGLLVIGCCGIDTDKLPPLPPGRMVEANGRNLFVYQEGAGPTVVLLHGLGDSSIGWQFVAPSLVTAGYRVIVWDALGAGRSDKPSDGDYGIPAHAERLVKVLDALDAPQATLVGHSLGGSVALLVARAHPERVQTLFLIDPGAYREAAEGGRWFWNTPWLARTVLAFMPSCSIARYGLKQNLHNRDAITENLVAVYLREARREGMLASLIAQERQLVPENPEAWEAGHRLIRARTFILWGKEDVLIPVAQGERLQKDIPGARLEILSDVGHSPHLESPNEVMKRLLAFLQEGMAAHRR